MTFSVPEKFRIRSGRVGSDASFGNNGAFEVRLRHNQTVYVIASDGAGWEHVSVSRRDRCPTWDEQYHPPRSEYVNNHPNCLHLWRPIGAALPMPDSILVGVKEAAKA